jgi:hypothetical protein
MSEGCTWCGSDVESDDGFRAYLLSATGSTGERRAAFCRLEHLVPWAIQGAHWEAGELPEGAPQAKPRSDPISGGPWLEEGASRCSHCGAELGETHVLLVRHRGEHRVPDAFCGVDHMTDWAKAGGRWQ